LEFPWKEMLSAAVTLTVAGLGYRQWKKGARSGAYLADREAAYKAVWQALEDLHLYVRTNPFEGEAFDRLVRAANAKMIRSGLHLDEADQAAARRYMETLKQLGALLATLPPGSLFHQEVGRTGAGAPIPSELLEAWRAFEAARAEVIAPFRSALGATQI
jgi:hypothetical protein